MPYTNVEATAKCATGPVLTPKQVRAVMQTPEFQSGATRIYALTANQGAIDRIHTVGDLERGHAGYWVGAGVIPIGCA